MHTSIFVACLTLLVTPTTALLPTPRPPVPRAFDTKLPAFASRVAAASAAVATVLPRAAVAVETASGTELPDDGFVVAFAAFLLVCVGALNLSLGDIAADEAQLPSSVNLINKSKKARNSFIKGKE